MNDHERSFMHARNTIQAELIKPAQSLLDTTQELVDHYRQRAEKAETTLQVVRSAASFTHLSISQDKLIRRALRAYQSHDERAGELADALDNDTWLGQTAVPPAEGNNV